MENIKCKLFNQYCCYFYGSPLWSLKSEVLEFMCVDWSTVANRHKNSCYVKIIKHMGPKALVRMKETMNTLLVSNKFPKLWRKFKVIAILKPVKNSSLLKIYRSISLLCHTYTLFERMILNRLKLITEQTIIKDQA